MQQVKGRLSGAGGAGGSKVDHSIVDLSSEVRGLK